MRLMTSALIGIGLVFGSVTSDAAGLQLKGRERWLNVANSDDVDIAIGIAKHYRGFGSKVVKSAAGQFSVVMGPYRAKSVAAIAEGNKESPIEVPKDASLTKGESYVGLVWDSTDAENEPSSGDDLLSPVVLDKPLTLQNENLSVEVLMPTTNGTAGPTKVVGTEGGVKVFDFTLGDSDKGEYSSLGATAGFVRLDKATDAPQLVINRNTAGAHCCNKTWFITKPTGQSTWVVVEGQSLDGGGYSYPDLDADGAREIVAGDNKFLYTFDSYADSFMPTQFRALKGAELSDLSKTPEMAGELKQDLSDLEFRAKLKPELWTSNGFLAAWVAAKVRLGQGEEAWTTALENYNKVSDFGPQECVSGQDVENCPTDNLKTIPFPKALAMFMQDNGYGPLPQAALSYTQ